MPSTQPTLWTPEAVVYVVTAIIAAVSLTLIPALVALVKANGANHVAKSANDKADIANTRSGNNAQAITGVQQQVTQIALQTTPPPPTPPDFLRAQISNPGELKP